MKPQEEKSNREIKVQKPILPKGGGTVQGMGETFASNAFNGSSSMSVPLPASPCRNFEPQLSLDYSSGNGHSPFGMGWELSAPSIVRKTALKIPTYDNTDTFLDTAGDYMVPKMTTRGIPVTGIAEINGKSYNVYYFLPYKEGEFEQIERYINAADPTDDFWKITNAENIISIFGKSSTAKISDSENPSHIFKWLLEETYNDKGDHQIYVYQRENSDNIPADISELNRDKQTQTYLTSVYYGNLKPIIDGSIVTGESKTSFALDQWHFEIAFDYGVYNIKPSNPSPHTVPPEITWPCRPDPFSDYSGGFETRTYRLCHNILLFHRFDILGPDAILVSALQLNHDLSPLLTTLSSVTHTGYRYTGNQIPYDTKSLPELCFTYTAFQPSQPGYQPHSFGVLVDESKLKIPQAATATLYQLIDLYGEGIPGILYQDGQSVFYRSALKVSETLVEYSEPIAVNFPAAGKISSDHLLADITGKGKLDLAITNPQHSGFWEMRYDQTWKNFIPFQSFPTNYSYPLNNYTDVTGDGVADVILISESNVQYNASLNKKGFAAVFQVSNDSQVPASKQNSPTEILFYADLAGSGLSQRVRITQNTVECWPNLGYGKFGKKIAISQAPDFGEDFDITRLLWADINGSGIIDLAYVYSDRLDIYLNQSGNSFSQTPISIPFPAQWDDLSHISFADIRGDGTNCLVFVQTHPKPQVWYYDFNLLKGQDKKGQATYISKKPYLLSQIDNNMGALTNINYCSSTKFYLLDKARGLPWITHLPYPVNVIESITYQDEISLTKTSVSYHYSHGYYDSYEKAFMGFGRVDVVNVANFEQYIAQDNPDLAAYQCPNNYTRTWYHTGAFEEYEALINQYKKEFWRGDTDSLSMSYIEFDFLSQNPPIETLRNAHQSLHGALLRTEVYGLDDSPWLNIPYSVSENQFLVKEIQQLFTNPYSCFLTYKQQGIDYDYERNAEDPRISHEFVLSTDFYGHVLESCSVSYPRRLQNILPSMDAQTREQQLLLRVSYSVNTIFNSYEAETYWSIHNVKKVSGGYLLGIAIENKVYEILELQSDDKSYFNLQGIKNQISQSFQDNPPNVNLLNWERSYFYQASTQKELSFGAIVCPALHHRTEFVEFNINQLTEDFSSVPFTSSLANLLTTGVGSNGARGGYISFKSGTDADSYYWNPGSSQGYQTASGFFLPNSLYDPFQYPFIYWGAIGGSQAQKTTYIHDAYFLFVQQITDPLSNTTSVTKFDYQVMQPLIIKDINGTSSSVMFDALGIVIAISHSGQQKGHPCGFTNLSSFVPFTTAQLDAAFQYPGRTLIDNEFMTVEAFFYYDLLSWKKQQIPPHIKSITRNFFSIGGPSPGNSDPLYQLQVVYSDGFGRVAQHKAFYDGTNQWLTSGTVRYDNKGQPIMKFEPWFDQTYQYDLQDQGLSELLFYDALSREVLLRTREGFFSKTLFGSLGTSLPIPTAYNGYLNKKLYATIGAVFHPSAWNSLRYDKNDSILDSSYTASAGNNVDHDAWQKALQFANTPFQHLEDSMGKVVQSSQINVLPLQQNSNYFTFDILGDQLTAADQRLHLQVNPNFQYSYSLSKELVISQAVDAGNKWQLHDVVNNIIFVADSNNTQQYYSYDALHRFNSLCIQNNNPQKGNPSLSQIVRHIIYGDSQNNGTPYFNNPQQFNLRGQPVIILDEAGLNIHPSFDINGHVLVIAQWIKTDYQGEANWNTISSNIIAQIVSAFQGKYQPADFKNLNLPALLVSLLEPQVFITSTELDALGKVTSSIDADGNTTTPQYYCTGWIKALSLSGGSLVQQANTQIPQPGFSNITYNAKGQRLSISYLNSTKVSYYYDPFSFELMHIKTVRNGIEVVQHLHYHHDLQGNITSLINLAAPTVFFKNQQVDAFSSYTYNALYQLTQATGREHAGMWNNVQVNQNKFNASFFANPSLWPQLTDSKALQNYTQNYHYDAGGNLARLQHSGAVAYTRKIFIQSDSNQIAYSSYGSLQPINYNYDNNGNMISLDGCQDITWNYRNNMQSAVIVNRSGDLNDAEYYVYNAAGDRVRKVFVKKTQNGSTLKETLYIGGIEIRRSYLVNTSGEKSLIKEWHQVKEENGESTFCIWRYWVTGTIKPDEKKVQLRYQLNDILNSSAYELDEYSALISYEEYYPYGGTSIIAAQSQTEVKTKHYHYSCKEKDNVTGLYYYGFRYYVSWLGRWTCPDPARTIDGLNICAFVMNNPLTKVDIYGMVSSRRSLRERSKRLPQQKSNSSKEEIDSARRIKRATNYEKKNYGRRGRNLFGATIKYGNLKVTFHLHSAGLGGSHPLDNSKSAAHTEQQWKALNRNQKLIKILLKRAYMEKKKINKSLREPPKAATDIRAIGMFSTNEGCNHNVSLPEGCGSIPAGKEGMGLQDNAVMHWVSPYGHGDPPHSHARVDKDISSLLPANEDDLMDNQSVDIQIDSDAFRGKEISKMSEDKIDEWVEFVVSSARGKSVRK